MKKKKKKEKKRAIQELICYQCTGGWGRGGGDGDGSGGQAGREGHNRYLFLGGQLGDIGVLNF
jgi:hypothetical protein